MRKRNTSKAVAGGLRSSGLVRPFPDMEGWWVKWRNYGGPMMSPEIRRIHRSVDGHLYYWSGFTYKTRLPAEWSDKGDWHGPFSQEETARKLAATQRPNAKLSEPHNHE